VGDQRTGKFDFAHSVFEAQIGPARWSTKNGGVRLVKKFEII